MFTDEIKQLTTLHETAFASFKSLLNGSKKTQGHRQITVHLFLLLTKFSSSLCTNLIIVRRNKKVQDKEPHIIQIISTVSTKQNINYAGCKEARGRGRESKRPLDIKGGTSEYMLWSLSQFLLASTTRCHIHFQHCALTQFLQ